MASFTIRFSSGSRVCLLLSDPESAGQPLWRWSTIGVVWAIEQLVENVVLGSWWLQPEVPACLLAFDLGFAETIQLHSCLSIFDRGVLPALNALSDHGLVEVLQARLIVAETCAIVRMVLGVAEAPSAVEDVVDATGFDSIDIVVNRMTHNDVAVDDLAEVFFGLCDWDRAELRLDVPVGDAKVEALRW